MYYNQLGVTTPPSTLAYVGARKQYSSHLLSSFSLTSNQIYRDRLTEENVQDLLRMYMGTVS